MFAHGVTAWNGSESYADWVEKAQPAIAEKADGSDPDLNVPGRFQSPGMPAVQGSSFESERAPDSQQAQ